MAVAKKTVAKKTTAKKTVAKKAAVKKTTANPESVLSSGGKTVEQVAEEVLKGKWNSGRERDDALRQAGFDPAEVNKEYVRQLNAAKPEQPRIARSKRGSSWM